MGIRATAAIMALAWIAPAAPAQFTASYIPGDFTYQFADPVTGQPITNVTLPTQGATAKVAVYLLQTGGNPPNLFQLLGVEGLGVRLIYNGGIVRVPNTGGTTGQMQTTIN